MRLPQRALLLIGLCFFVLPLESSKPARPATPPDEFPALTFDELVTLSNTDTLPADLEAKLNTVLQTATVHNETSAGAPPRQQLTDPKIGPVMRVALWNIERGFQLDLMKQALVDPEKFEEAVDAGKKRTEAQRASSRDQAETLRQSDILILNEVDMGMKRTDYRDVARELAETLKMNYVYGVEFVEVDGLEDLGTESSHLETTELTEKMDADLKPDPALYRGFHGNAILSRYPMRQAKIYRLPVCHDWYADERKEISKLEQGKRLAANKVFLERIEREVRRGNRMALVADVTASESPTGVITVVNAHLENKTAPCLCAES
jgi:hypothetical protein